MGGLKRRARQFTGPLVPTETPAPTTAPSTKSPRWPAVNAKTVCTARTVVIAAILLIFTLLLFTFAFGGGTCEAAVRIVGRLVDEDGNPLAGEELTFNFYVSPHKRDQVVTTMTGPTGDFLLETTVIQSAYENSQKHCMEIQARMLFADDTTQFRYQPGGQAEMSGSAAYESWAAAGRYQGGEIRLFHGIRITTAGDQLPDLTDIAITLGTTAEPCLFQLESDNSDHGEPVTVTVRHLDVRTKDPLAAEESFTSTTTQLAQPEGLQLYPKTISGMAPLKVTEEDENMVEAKRGSPITSFQVGGPNQQRNTNQRKVIFYYDKDRDGDGVPDYEVSEQHLTTSGKPLSGQAVRSSLYAYQDTYQGQVLSAANYRYQGYQQDQETLVAGLPGGVVTGDTLYRYIYKKQSGSGGGPAGPLQPEEPRPPGETETPEQPGPPPDDEDDFGLPVDPPPAAPQVNDEGTPQHQPRNETRPAVPEPEPAEDDVSASARQMVTFVKQSYQQEVQPGEEIVYHFTGVQNPFDDAVEAFALLDEPEPGLDLVAIQLPAFQGGAGLTYDITCTTSDGEERTLRSKLPADQPAFIKPLPLEPEVYITAAAIQFGKVPGGFGAGGEITFTFRVWEEPPQEVLHNLGFLYYEDEGKPVYVRSEKGPSIVAIRAARDGRQDSHGDWAKAKPRDWLTRRQSAAHRGGTNIGLLVPVLLAAAIITVAFYWKRQEEDTGEESRNDR